MKNAVYMGTRNMYENMLPSIKSLLANSDVDKIYLLIEDDVFPFKLPKEVECINVSGQTYFRKYGPNIRDERTYMVLMRAALCKVLEDVDVVLALDADAIVDADISGLWNTKLNGKYFAAVPEPKKTTDKRLYCNMGVALFNLELLREGKGDEIINALNNRRYDFLEQDCLNALCQGGIVALDSAYNANAYTADTKHPKIHHYAGVREWEHLPLVEKYREQSFDELRKPKSKSKASMFE